MNNEVLEILKSVGAIITDSHFVYTSGKHSSRYVNKMILFAHPFYASKIGELFAKKVLDKDIDVVVAPALGGIILSTWTAYHLSQLKGKEILGIFTEKTETSDQVFKRGYDKLVKNKKVLVVEDIVTTGGSVKKVTDSVKQAGGTVIETSVMLNINEKPESITEEIIGSPFSSLINLPAEIYDPANCPLCKNNIPINTTVGHGKKYLAEKGKV
jgi:orotate phosphoribosyltransferase